MSGSIGGQPMTVISDEATETRLRDAALVLMDLAMEATKAGPDTDPNVRFAMALSTATQALLMSDELRPGASLSERKHPRRKGGVLARFLGVADGLGHSIGCIRSPTGQIEVMTKVGGAMSTAALRCDRSLRDRGF